jgi:hypothetical protein
MPVQNNEVRPQNTDTQQQSTGLGVFGELSSAVSGMCRHAVQVGIMTAATTGLFGGAPMSPAQGQEPVPPNPATAPKNPGEELPAPAPIKALTYAEAVKSVRDSFDKTVTGNGYTVNVSTELLTDKELDALAQGLIKGAGAPSFISGMPLDFSKSRLSAMTRSTSAIPYVNHEGRAIYGYSLELRSEPNRPANKAMLAIEKMEKATGLTVLGITPLDHPKALYAVAVKQEAGTIGWGLAGIEKGHIPSPGTGNGPRHTDIHAAIPAMLHGMKK